MRYDSIKYLLQSAFVVWKMPIDCIQYLLSFSEESDIFIFMKIIDDQVADGKGRCGSKEFYQYQQNIYTDPFNPTQHRVIQ